MNSDEGALARILSLSGVPRERRDGSGDEASCNWGWGGGEVIKVGAPVAFCHYADFDAGAAYFLESACVCRLPEAL